MKVSNEFQKNKDYFNLHKLIEKCSSAICKYPNDSQAYFVRAKAKFDLSDYNGASNDFEEVLNINSFDIDALMNYGLSKYLIGNYECAINAFTQALEITPRNAICWYHRGLTYMALKSFDYAILDFEEAITLNPTNKRQYQNMQMRALTKQSRIMSGQANSQKKYVQEPVALYNINEDAIK